MALLSINMKFWHDGKENSTRIRNVEFCWKRLKHLYAYLIDRNISCVINLYDFSESKYIEDAKHIPYPIGVYKKAEKTNIILKEQSNHKFFMMVDSDAFFDYSDYNNLSNLIGELADGDAITFDLAKLNDNIQNYIIDGEFYKDLADWSYAYSGQRERGPLFANIGGLGGVYICDTNLLLNVGGFNEQYAGWGGEDGEILQRIRLSTHSRIKPTRNFAPYHLPHFYDWYNPLYRKQ